MYGFHNGSVIDSGNESEGEVSHGGQETGHDLPGL